MPVYPTDLGEQISSKEIPKAHDTPTFNTIQGVLWVPGS